eukprot:TRINITY_DN2712_c0_g1_i1.p1 TRINITY_DN2712_c0_g1~~TRINITY_DN2712_c0_g1_i1.p1  ORF type:complete len:862 (-),score=166.80 TRINITY_DN2712_c0_g1_i1:63-2648(-)
MEKCNLVDVPVFHPTEQEFMDPIRYIQNIRPIAAKYGICKIIPPRPPERLQGPSGKRRGFRTMSENQVASIDPTAFKFHTKLQKVHQLQKREGPNETFINDLQRFLSKTGNALKMIPRIDGKELDFYKLFRAVAAQGGSKAVTQHKMWPEIAAALKLSKDPSTANTLSTYYSQYLYTYERSFKRRKALWDEGVTPGCSEDTVEMLTGKKMEESTSNNNNNNNIVKDQSSSSITTSTTANGKVTYSSFHCRRCTREVPNTDSGIRTHLDLHFARDLESGATNVPEPKPETIVPMYVLRGETKGGASAAIVQNSASNRKRKMMDEKQSQNQEARKKRRIEMIKSIKFDCRKAPTKAANAKGRGKNGSAMDVDAKPKSKSDSKSKSGKNEASSNIDVENIMCSICEGGEDEDQMLLCDTEGCGNAHHMYCLKKPLNSVPQGDWYCDECVEDLYTRHEPGDGGNADFGFGEGREFSLESYKKMANTFKKKWFELKDSSSENVPQVENEFWRIVETSEDFVKVHYGSDICTATNNISGFPKPLGIPEMDYSFNLHLLATSKGSPLRFLQEEISGVTIPMLYVGMLFSCFCWHTEDNYLYSINYLHFGSPKSWYGVPGFAAEKFESVMNELFPELFKESPDLLHHLTTMVSPCDLVSKGVPVYHQVQYPGEFIITFPQAYHAGFNHGFNCAESVNFATPDWLPYGRKAGCRYRKTKRSAVFSHQELICKAIAPGAVDPDCKELADRTIVEVTKLCENEARLREKITNEGITRLARMTKGEDENRQCAQCNFDCYLSAVCCSACGGEGVVEKGKTVPIGSGKVVCLRHSKNLCKCKPDKKVLLVLKTLNELEQLKNSFIEKCGKLFAA